MFLEWYAIFVTIVASLFALSDWRSRKCIQKNIAVIESQDQALKEKERLYVKALEDLGSAYRESTVLGSILAAAGPLEIQRLLAKAKTSFVKLGLRGLGTLPEPHGEIFRNKMDQDGKNLESHLRAIMKKWHITIP